MGIWLSKICLEWWTVLAYTFIIATTNWEIIAQSRKEKISLLDVIKDTDKMDEMYDQN